VRTAGFRCKTASCAFSATAQLISATVQNAEITQSYTLIFTAVTQNHGDGRKSLHAAQITVKVTVIRDYLTCLLINFHFCVQYYCWYFLHCLLLLLFCTLHLLFVFCINYLSYHRWPALMGILPFLAACYV